MYLSRADIVLAEFGWQGIRSPALLVEMWEQFVEVCEEGYAWGLVEFDEDVFVREALEVLLVDETLNRFPEFDEVVHAIRYLDGRLRKVILTGVERSDGRFWWQRLVLSYACSAYADGIADRYGFAVEARDGSSQP